MTKRIYVAYTGGTFGMTRTPSGYQPQPGLAQRLAGLLPAAGEAGMPAWELHEYARLIDSAEAGPRDWHAVARDITARYDDYDGFVVIHGTDTMAYTASALSFALAGVKKPVIVTGAQIPLAEPRSDARDNLLAALLIAANHPLPEVCLYFHGRLMRGNRATKVSSVAFDAFASPNWPVLGRVGIAITIDRRAVLAPPEREAFVLTDPAGAGEVALLRLYPGLSVGWLVRLLEPPLAGLVLQSYGAGNGPVGLPGFVDALAAASAHGTVIVNVSQCAEGGIDPRKYATGSALADAGVVGASDMTVEAALTKLHHLLARGLGADTVRQRFAEPLCGECASPSADP
ncbi:MAG TPA: asparaginase [Rhodocyclaceae bacterium]|nr:asparaginase [Rhodocyclaceae bacterium]